MDKLERYCISRVSLKNKNRCHFLKKNGNYCKKHQDKYILFGNFNKPDIDIKEKLKNVNESNYSCNLMKSLNKKDIEFVIYYNKAYLNNIKLEQYIEDITLKGFSKYRFKKNDLIIHLNTYFKIKNSQKYYENQVKNIIKCQAIIRGYLLRKMLGPCIFDITKCINSSDVDGTEFWEEVNNIKKKTDEIVPEYQRTIFSFVDNNSIYAFSLRTMRKLMETTKKNPYTGLVFSSDIQRLYRKRMDFMNRMKYEIVPKCIIDEELKYLGDEQKQLNTKVFDVFHNIHLLGYFVEHDWFLNLSTGQLKDFYYYLKKTWYNYNVTYNEKMKIIPNIITLFYLRQRYVDSRYSDNNKNELQKIIINIIEKLTTCGINNDYKRIGCWVVLKALKQVSNEAAQYIAY